MKKEGRTQVGFLTGKGHGRIGGKFLRV